ncbi:MAG: hypothetical protein WD847_20330 [Pirellulales bacterium]
MDPSHIEIDDFLLELTHALVKFGTRSKEVKTLVRLAERHEDPEVKRLAEAKLRLQREFEQRHRLPGPWDWLPTLTLWARNAFSGRPPGRVLHTVLLVVATLLGVELGKNWLGGPSEASTDEFNLSRHLDRIAAADPPAIPLADDSFDDWLLNKINQALQDDQFVDKVATAVKNQVAVPGAAAPPAGSGEPAAPGGATSPGTGTAPGLGEVDALDPAAQPDSTAPREQ